VLAQVRVAAHALPVVAGNVTDAVLQGTVQVIMLAIEVIDEAALELRAAGFLVDPVEGVVVLEACLLGSTEYEDQKARSEKGVVLHVKKSFCTAS
jgi:hypothetical protein